jgi:hypothetical protein
MRQRPYLNRFNIDWPRFGSQIVYLPGAIIMLFGLYLTLTI